MIQNRSIQDYIFVIVVALMAIGALFVFSAAADINQQIQLDNFYRFTALRQLMFFPLAVMVMVCFSFFNYRKLAIPNNFLKSPAVWLMILSIIFSAAVLFPKFGTEINYARRWLRIPLGSISLSFQPSELAKWSTIFFVSAYCDRFHDSLGLYRKRFIPICTIVAFVVGLILIEDFGTAAFVALLSFIILIAAGVKFTHILTLVPPASVAFLIALLSSNARIDRIKAFLNPDKFAESVNYQANQSLIAIGSGEVWGKGLGRGICKYGHLPEDTTDFIFAIIGEEMGLIGTAAVIILFMFFVWLGFLVVIRCKDRLGRFLACGIVIAVGMQAAINIGVVTVVLPTKGIPLPFISAGGTSLLISAAAIGILLNIAKQLPQEETIQIPQPQTGELAHD